MTNSMKSFINGLILNLCNPNSNEKLLYHLLGDHIASIWNKSYTPVEYIQFDGSHYIDTGIICTQNTTIEVSFSRDNTTTSCYLYGVTNSGNTASVTAYLTSGSGNWRFGNTYVGQTISKDTLYNMTINNDGVIRNGSTYNFNGTVKTFTAP